MDDEKRRASFSVFQFPGQSPRWSLSISPRPSISRSARASFSRSHRGSTVALEDALDNINWSPILGGSRYSVNRSSISRSSNASVKHDVIITIKGAGKCFIICTDHGLTFTFLNFFLFSLLRILLVRSFYVITVSVSSPGISTALCLAVL